jgi:hypothetical protein
VGVLGKDVEDQGRPVEDAQVSSQGLFEFALVTRVELVVEDDQVGQSLLRQGFEFLYLTGTIERVRVRGGELLGQFADNIQSGGIGQQGQFGQRVIQREQALLPENFHTD